MTRRRNRPPPEQLDLFERTPGETAPCAPESRPRRDESWSAARVAELPGEALLDALTRQLYGVPDIRVPTAVVIRELAARGEARAVPLLVRVCRRHAGYDRQAPAPELLAALTALHDLAAAEAAQPVLDLVRQQAFGPAATAAALALLARLRHRPAAVLVEAGLADGAPAVRAATCLLAAALGLHDRVPALVALMTDPDRAVARAAVLALGHLGHRPIKPVLEEAVTRALPVDVPAYAEALVEVADADTAVILGRVAERSDETVRAAIAGVLARIPEAAAVTVLVRLALDPRPGVRRAVAPALAAHDDARIGPALAALGRDPHPEVRAAAQAALRALGAEDTAEAANDWA